MLEEDLLVPENDVHELVLEGGPRLPYEPA